MSKAKRTKIVIRQFFSRKNLFAKLVAIGLVVIAFCIVVIALDIRLPLINPPEKETTRPIPLYIYITNRTLLPPPDILVLITLHYNSTTIIEGQPVHITATSEIYNPAIYASNFQGIIVGFDNAFKYPLNYTGIMPHAANLLLSPIDANLKDENKTVCWMTSGDFSPIVRVFYTTGDVESNFDWINIHVEPASELTAERNIRITTGITLALTYFAFIEGISLYIEHTRKKID